MVERTLEKIQSKVVGGANFVANKFDKPGEDGADPVADPALGFNRAISSVGRKKDTGVFWDESLDLFIGGTININLYNNVLGYNAGETISGTLDIEIKETFDASDLIIEFKGVERGHLCTDSVLSVKDYHREEKEVICMKQVVVQFPEGQNLQPG